MWACLPTHVGAVHGLMAYLRPCLDLLRIADVVARRVPRKRLTIRTPKPRARQSESQAPRQHGLRAWARSTRLWVGAVIVGSLAALFNSGILALPGQLVDTPAAKDKVRRGPDFSMSTEVVREDDEGRSAVTRQELRLSAAQEQMLARPGSVGSTAFDQLLRAKAAANLDVVTIRVTLTGHRNQEIDIEDIRPLITARTAPLSGSLLCAPPQGGAPTMNMLYDMDRPFPVAHDVQPPKNNDGGLKEGLGPPFFDQRTITLHDHEQQVLLIRAVTAQHYVAFRLEADYLLGTQKKRAVIDNHGKPFEVSALILTPPGGKSAYRSVYRMQDNFSLRRVNPTGPTC